MSRHWLALLVVGGCGGVGLEEAGGLPAVEVRPADVVDFGCAVPGGQAAEAEITIRSTGQDLAVLQEISLETADGTFRIGDNPAPAVLYPGEEVVVDLRFLPPGFGAYAEWLEVVVDLEATRTFERQLIGSGCSSGRDPHE